MDEALELKELIYEKGVIPDNYTYTILLDGFYKNRRTQDARILLDEMVSRVFEAK